MRLAELGVWRGVWTWILDGWRDVSVERGGGRLSGWEVGGRCGGRWSHFNLPACRMPF